MKEFFTGANLVWLIGIISSILAGLNALRKFRYEKKLDQFKEANLNLFKKEKEQVLAAISTLAIFKRDRRFENHTTNVLLSRLYTELDYDVTNAICNTLIQYSNRKELMKISAEILDINRNFFVQATPVSQMIIDLDSSWKNLKYPPNAEDAKKTQGSQTANVDNTNTINEIERSVSNELLEQYEKRSLEWIPKKRYELTWHKQITADTYSRILRRACHLHVYEGKTKYNFLKKLKRTLHISSGLTNELDMAFYQNDFNYVYMAAFRTSTCSIERSALGYATIVDVKFNNISRISGSSFAGTLLFDCNFNGGVIGDKSSFERCVFGKGKFEGIFLDGVSFQQSEMDEVIFSSSDSAKENQVTCQILNGTFNEGIYTNCKFRDCEIKSTTFTNAYFTNVVFENVRILNGAFNEGSYSNCKFLNCSIIGSTFANSLLTNVMFENVNFKDVYFIGSDLKEVDLKKCKGLAPLNFYNIAAFDAHTQWPEDFKIESMKSVQKSQAKDDITKSVLLEVDKTYMLERLN